MDYVSKCDELKIDLDKQESVFHQRLLKRRMTSAHLSHRSMSRRYKTRSLRSSPKNSERNKSLENNCLDFE